MKRRMLGLMALLWVLSCSSAKPGTDRALIGDFVSGTINEQKNGISLRGQFLWHGKIEGQNGSIQLSGSFR